MKKAKNPARLRDHAPLIAIIHITLAVLLGWLAPLPLPAPTFVQWFGFGFAALGLILDILALIEFKRSRARLDPKKPAKSLVTSGIYNYTRNPTYLGFVFMLIGLPLNMGNYWGVILIWPLVTFMNNLIIKNEEIYLEREFKDQYLVYKSNVKRWL